MKEFNAPKITTVDNMQLEPVYAASGVNPMSTPTPVPVTPTPMPSPFPGWNIEAFWDDHDSGKISSGHILITKIQEDNKPVQGQLIGAFKFYFLDAVLISGHCQAANSVLIDKKFIVPFPDGLCTEYYIGFDNLEFEGGDLIHNDDGSIPDYNAHYKSYKNRKSKELTGLNVLGREILVERN